MTFPLNRFVITALISLVYGQYPAYGQYEGISNVSTSACPSQGGAHLIVARASSEPLGYGIIGAVKDQVLAQVPGSTAEFVYYPAILSPDYVGSETTGVIAMRELIDAFVSNCSGSPLVLMGYSQGAQVTADSLAGQDDAGFPDNSTVDQPPPASTLNMVAAAILMGDPTFTKNDSFSVGNATRGGIFTRRNTANFQTGGLASRMQSYCDDGDPYCAFGKNISVHLGYVQEYGADATAFVVKQIKNYYAMGSGSNGTATNGNAPSSTPEPYTGSASRTAIVAAIPSVLLAGLFALFL